MKLPTKERTLVLIKTDAVSRHLAGEILNRFEKVGLEIVALKMVRVNEDIALKHYGQNEEWFERIGTKMREFYDKTGFDLDEDLAQKSNRELGEMVQQWNIDYLSEGKVIAMVLEGYEAIAVVRKMVGATYPKDAMPGTIRGDYSQDSPITSNMYQRSVRNLVHSSGTVEEAQFEIDLWFKKEELMETVDA